jgi:hypothetical protein
LLLLLALFAAAPILCSISAALLYTLYLLLAHDGAGVHHAQEYEKKSQFDYQNVDRNTWEIPIHMLSVGTSASWLGFVNVCFIRIMSYLMVERSAVVAVEMDLVVVLADADAHCLVFVITLLPPHGLSLSPHCFLCMGIVFSSWLFLVYGLGQRLRDIRSRLV